MGTREGQVDVAGYTAVELVVLVAVTAIVGALAVSAYRTYSVRGEISASLDRAERAQTTVAAAFRQAGEPPADPEAAGLAGDAARGLGPFVGSLDVVHGRIDLVFGREADPALRGRRLSLTPYETTELEVVWVCGNEIADPGLKPLGFMAGGRRAQQIPATVEARYLPPRCR
jgi:type IV pilus assembly protein PilA